MPLPLLPVAGTLVASIMTGLIAILKTRLGLFIVTAMVWLGINWGSFTLILEPTLDLLEGMTNNLGSGSGQYASHARAWVGVMNLDKAITMLISAVVTKHALLQGRLMLFKRGVAAP